MRDSKNKHVLVKVKDLSEKQLDAAIDDALDALFGQDEQPPKKKPVPGKPKSPSKGKTKAGK